METKKTHSKMDKKIAKKPTAAKLAAQTYPAEQQALESQQQRLKNAAAAGASALKSSVSAKATKTPSNPVTAASQSPEPTSQTTLVAGTPTPPTPLRVPVTFALPDLGAECVALSGEFNNWSPDATRMKRHGDGHWQATLELPPGRYQYKLILDGNWIPDPLARENVLNEHGTLNSVIEVNA